RYSPQCWSAMYEGWLSVWLSARWSTSPSLVPGSSEGLHAASSVTDRPAAAAVVVRRDIVVVPPPGRAPVDHCCARGPWVRASGGRDLGGEVAPAVAVVDVHHGYAGGARVRSEEHTSELQSRENLVCRLLLE